MSTTAFSLRSYATLSMAMVGLLFFTNWPVYQYSVLGGVVPLVFYFGAMVLACVLVLFLPRVLVVLLREPLFRWFFIYALSGLIWVVFGGDVGADNYDWRLRFLLWFLFSAGVVLSTLVDVRQFAKVLLLAMVFATFTYWHDFLNPFLYVPQGAPGSNPGRGAGLFINANQAGIALIAMSIAAMPFIDKQWRTLILIVVLLGVVPTFSRASIIFAIIVAGVWIYSNFLQLRNLFFLLLGMPLAAFVGYQLFNIGIVSTDINYENVIERIAFFMALGEANDSSATERVYLTALGWEKFLANPFTGIGVGNTDLAASTWGYNQSTHNMYLRLLVEQGILGGLLYLSFLAIIFVRGWRLVRSSANLMKSTGQALLLLALYFMFLGFFSHNLLQDPVSTLILAFLLSVARRLELEALQSSQILVQNRSSVLGG